MSEVLRGVLKDVEEKKGTNKKTGKDFHQFVYELEDGSKFSSLNDLRLNVGWEVVVPISRNGQWVNFDFSRKSELKQSGQGGIGSFVSAGAPRGTFSGAGNKEGYWERKSAQDLVKDKRIGRMACLNTAVEILKLAKAEADLTAEQALANTLICAEKLELWVNRDGV